jgi:hypothetical protein
MEHSAREMRLSSMTRAVVIVATLGVYTWVSKQPAVSLTAGLLVAAGLQLAVIGVRRFVPAGQQPLALYMFEFIADGVTLILFALTVFGGIHRVSMAA